MSMIPDSLIRVSFPMPMPHFLSYCNTIRLLYLDKFPLTMLSCCCSFQSLQSAILALFFFHVDIRVSLLGRIKNSG